MPDPILERELAYYDTFYSSEGISHFAKPAVVAFREYLIRRILRSTGAGPQTRVLSIGCGIGDTELLLAPRVAHITGLDLSSKAIEEAQRRVRQCGIHNVAFVEGPWQALSTPAEPFDLAIAVFFLHHLSDPDLAAFPNKMSQLIRKGGVFYALEPSARRLSGFLGRLLVPSLMKKYQTEDERQLLPRSTAALFERAGFNVTTPWFDFASTPLAGLFPSWTFGYKHARLLDEALTACPGVRALSSNFEVLARR